MNWIYTRRSTGRQSDVSLELQEETCRRWVEEPITAIHETGSGADNTRPQLNYMLANLQPQDCVCIYDNSRLARSMIDSITILKAITDKGATLICDGKRIDPENPQDLFTFNVHSAFSDYQLLIQRQKSKEGSQRRTANGDRIFAGDTFGYELSKKNGQQIVSVIPEEAEIVKYVYEEYVKGKPIKELERELWGKVLHRPFQFNIQNLRPMLQRTIYMGKYTDTAGMQKHIMRYTEEELREHLITSNYYPPIISEELYFEAFHRLRTYRENHAIPYKNRWTKHTLSGLYKCSGCGKGITFRNRYRDGKHFETYVFQSHTPDCSQLIHTQFDALWLEKCTQACFLLTFLDGARVGAFFAEQRSKLDVDSVSVREELNLIEKELKKNEDRKDRVIDAISDGLITKSDAQKKLDKIETEHHSLKEREKTLRNALASLNQDIDDLLRFSAQEILDTYTGREREYYFRYVKSAINYHKYMTLEFMNGVTYEIHKPRRTNVATKPAVINVSVNGEQYYSFVFSPKMEIEKIYSSNEYMTDTLERWRKLVNSELSMTEAIILT